MAVGAEDILLLDNTLVPQSLSRMKYRCYSTQLLEHRRDIQAEIEGFCTPQRTYNYAFSKIWHVLAYFLAWVFIYHLSGIEKKPHFEFHSWGNGCQCTQPYEGTNLGSPCLLWASQKGGSSLDLLKHLYTVFPRSQQSSLRQYNMRKIRAKYFACLHNMKEFLQVAKSV